MEGGPLFLKRSTQPRYSEVTASPPFSLHLHSLSVFLLTPCLFRSFHTHIFLSLSSSISFPLSWSPLLIVPFSQISCLPALWFHLRYVKTSFFSLLTSGAPPWFWKACFTFFFFFLKSCGWCISHQLKRQWVEGRPLPPPFLQFSSVQFSRSVVSNSLGPHESQHSRPPCPSPTPGVHSDSHPSCQWCHPAISSSVVPFSSCPQSLPASESFPRSQLFAGGGQSTGVSALASFLPKKSQDWSPLEWGKSTVAFFS